MQVDLGQNQGAGFLQLSRDEGVVVRSEPLQAQRAARGIHVSRIDIVLEQQGNAMQRTNHSFRFQGCVHFIGNLQRPGIDQNHGVQRRPLLVEFLDPFQIHLRQAATGQNALLHRPMDLGNRRFLQYKNTRVALHCHPLSLSFQLRLRRNNQADRNSNGRANTTKLRIMTAVA